MSLATIRVVGASLLACAAFLGCGRSRPVPSQGEDPTGAPASTTAPRTTTTKSSSLGTATVFPAGTRRITVEGAALAPAAGEFRGAYAFDADGDGDRDVLALVRDGGALALVFARRDRDAFGAPESIDTFTASGEACELDAPSLAELGASYVLVSGTCGGDDGASVYWLVDREGAPRVGERLVRSAGGNGPTRVTFEAKDLDADGHEDVTAAFMNDEGSPVVTLAWFDRPGGLARDTKEPDATLGALRDATLKGSNNGERLAKSTAFLDLHDALCRGTSAPARWHFGGLAGLPCSGSKDRDRIVARRATATAASGSLLEALALVNALPEAVRTAEAAELTAAIRQNPRAVPVAPTPGPAITLPPAPRAHLSRVAFLDRDHVLVRGETPQVFEVPTGSLAPAPPGVSGNALIKQPDGSLAITEVRSACRGDLLSAVRAGDIVGGVAIAKPVAHATLRPTAATDGDCKAEDTGTPTDAWHALGWSPQGPVFVNVDHFRVVPWSRESGFGESFELGAGSPLPAPLPPGLVSANGSVVVVPLPAGILLEPIGRPGDARLLLPGPNWSNTEDLAVSDDAKRIAFLADGKLWLVELP